MISHSYVCCFCFRVLLLLYGHISYCLFVFLILQCFWNKRESCVCLVVVCCYIFMFDTNHTSTPNGYQRKFSSISSIRASLSMRGWVCKPYLTYNYKQFYSLFFFFTGFGQKQSWYNISYLYVTTYSVTQPNVQSPAQLCFLLFQDSVT